MPDLRQYSAAPQVVCPHRVPQSLSGNGVGSCGGGGGDLGRGQDGEAVAAPQRAVTAEPTQATAKRPAARRVFEEKPPLLRCSSVGDRCGHPPSSRFVRGGLFLENSAPRNFQSGSQLERCNWSGWNSQPGRSRRQLAAGPNAQRALTIQCVRGTPDCRASRPTERAGGPFHPEFCRIVSAQIPSLIRCNTASSISITFCRAGNRPAFTSAMYSPNAATRSRCRRRFSSRKFRYAFAWRGSRSS